MEFNRFNYIKQTMMYFRKIRYNKVQFIYLENLISVQHLDFKKHFRCFNNLKNSPEFAWIKLEI